MTDHEPSERFAELRLDYRHGRLVEQDLDECPIRQFQRWFDDARAASSEPNAMTLATSTPEGMPSARIVLLKGLDERGFVFYTNYESRKGHELADNPMAALVFYWAPLERQVRVTGEVARISRAETEAYFQSRPRGSQLSACISNQSQPVSRDQLEAEWQALESTHADQPIPVPENWGGYRLDPKEIEFWQGRESRLHDRLVYQRTANGWTIVRLAP
ncbi:MAG: pyridoxamine 5'-phosphate oxidase [Planctomycetota bacterium]